MRERLMAPLALMVLVPATVWAAGRAAETCVSAGYRVGTAAFDTCVARVGGDDPLSALEGGALSVQADKGHADKGDRKAAEANPLTALTPARPAVPTAVLPVQPAREELPLSFNTPSPMAAPPPPPPPGGGNSGAPPSPSAGFGGWWPTAPTAPTLPAVVGPNVPAWNFGGQ